MISCHYNFISQYTYLFLVYGFFKASIYTNGLSLLKETSTLLKQIGWWKSIVPVIFVLCYCCSFMSLVSWTITFNWPLDLSWTYTLPNISSRLNHSTTIATVCATFVGSRSKLYFSFAGWEIFCLVVFIMPFLILSLLKIGFIDTKLFPVISTHYIIIYQYTWFFC